MKRQVLAVLLGFTLLAACSKENGQMSFNDAPVSSDLFIGKWVKLDRDLGNLSSRALASALPGGLKASPYSDTLIYLPDNQYILINNGDTADRGTYELGHGKGMNGYGRIQEYDSLLYKTYSLTHDAPFSPVVYFKFQRDVLQMSQLYFRDSATERFYESYRKVD